MITKDELAEKAIFVAGIPAYDRPEDPKFIEDVIYRAESLLAAFSKKGMEPSVYSGTTNSPDNVLVFLWLRATKSGINEVAARLKTDMRWELYARSAEGIQVTYSDLLTEDVIQELNCSSINHLMLKI